MACTLGNVWWQVVRYPFPLMVSIFVLSSPQVPETGWRFQNVALLLRRKYVRHRNFIHLYISQVQTLVY